MEPVISKILNASLGRCQSDCRLRHSAFSLEDCTQYIQVEKSETFLEFEFAACRGFNEDQLPTYTKLHLFTNYNLVSVARNSDNRDKSMK